MGLIKTLGKHLVINVAVSVIVIASGHLIFYVFG